jgi:hypothetical protein
MRYIVTAMPQRLESVKELKFQIPHLEIVWDRHKDAMETFLRACAESGDDGVIRLEDDVEVTSNFCVKAEAIIEQIPNTVIQFFSRRKEDATIGSRWRSGATFLCNPCFYTPPSVNKGILEFAPQWKELNPQHPTGTDLLVAGYLKSQGMRYWNHVPSLVQHRIMKSLIYPSRSSKRQSTTFER